MSVYIEGHGWSATPWPANMEVGEGSRIRAHFAFRHYRSRRPVGLRIGRHTGVYSGVSFDLGPSGEVWIGDHCSIASPTFSTNRRIVFGDYVMAAWDVVIGDSPFATPRLALDAAAEDENPGPPEESIVIGDNVWITARSTILRGARIGNDVIVGAGAIVDFEVPDNSTVVGNPARVIPRTTSRAV